MTTAASDSPAAPAAPPWHDPKRALWLLGLVAPAQPFVAGALVALTGNDLLWFWGAFFLFVLIPLVDWAVGTDAINPPEEAVSWLEQDRYYRWCTYAFLPLQYAALVWSCWVLGSDQSSTVGKVGLAITVGLVGGVAINTAHELGHKRDEHERWLSKIALAQSAYGHFYLEHNRGHHVRVATPEDPASSRLGESFWAFLPRTVIGSLRSAWALESSRYAKAGKSHWTWRNDALNAWAMTAVLFAGLILAFGLEIGPYLVLQAVVGFSLLEVVNYLEHYGLLRQRSANGRYERTRPEHSWNSNNTASNVLLYHLQRHSDHHANPTRRYQALRSMDAAPQLPTGYGGMIVVALLTPLWRRVMDKRLLAHYGGDLSRCNIQPSKRVALAARYGPAA